MLRICGLPESPFHFRPNPVIFHDSGDSVLPASSALFAKLFGYPGAAVNPSALLVDLLNAIQQHFVFFPAFARFSRLPGIISASGDSKRLAHPCNAIGISMLFNEQVLYQLRLEKTLKAFFKMSRSSLTSSSSF